MRRRDNNNTPSRNALYATIRAEFRLRQTIRSVRQISRWTIAGVVFLVLGVAFRSWILFAAFGVLLLLTAAQWGYGWHYLSRARLRL